MTIHGQPTRDRGPVVLGCGYNGEDRIRTVYVGRVGFLEGKAQEIELPAGVHVGSIAGNEIALAGPTERQRITIGKTTLSQLYTVLANLTFERE